MPLRSIPDRWLDYNPVGRQMEGTRFISFKVPLKVGVCSSLPSESRFTIPDLLQRISDQGGRLGMVIDLTFTTRYYNKQDIINEGITYEKIFTAGKEVPSEDVVQEFASIVHNFETQSKDDSLIGVHCTHGVNRTGYLVCRYLIDYKGFTADKAIAAFNEARGHDLERENYLEDLQQRSALIQSGKVQPPKQPSPRKQGPMRRRDQPSSIPRHHTPYDRQGRDGHHSGGASDLRDVLQGRRREDRSFNDGYYRANGYSQHWGREQGYHDYHYYQSDHDRNYSRSPSFGAGYSHWAEDNFCYDSWDNQPFTNYHSGPYNGDRQWRHSDYRQPRFNQPRYNQPMYSQQRYRERSPHQSVYRR